MNNLEIARIENKVLNNLHTKSVHHGVACSNCEMPHIKGPRFVCLDCNGFNLCRKCKLEHQHCHQNFFELPYSGFHEGITCAICRIANIPNIRFHCKVCEQGTC